MPRGHGYALRTRGTSTTFCFSNNLTATIPLQLPAGYSLVFCQTNGAATFEMIVGRAPDPGTRLYRFIDQPGNNPLSLDETNYTIYTFADGAWSPSTPVADIGEAVWVFQSPTIVNLQTTSCQISFDALTPMSDGLTGTNSTLTVECTTNLEDANAWLVLTNFTGFGNFANVADPIDTNGIGQRFYRLNVHKP